MYESVPQRMCGAITQKANKGARTLFGFEFKVLFIPFFFINVLSMSQKMNYINVFKMALLFTKPIFKANTKGKQILYFSQNEFCSGLF